MKILIVEDEEMIREGVSDYLTDCGYEIIEAAVVPSALTLLRLIYGNNENVLRILLLDL